MLTEQLISYVVRPEQEPLGCVIYLVGHVTHIELDESDNMSGHTGCGNYLDDFRISEKWLRTERSRLSEVFCHT